MNIAFNVYCVEEPEQVTAMRNSNLNIYHTNVERQGLFLHRTIWMVAAKFLGTILILD